MAKGEFVSKGCRVMEGGIDGISVVSVLWPDGHFRFQLMKRKQKSSQNKPSSGRFDAPRTRFQQAGTR
jgi:hypothetical protein